MYWITLSFSTTSADIDLIGSGSIDIGSKDRIGTGCLAAAEESTDDSDETGNTKEGVDALAAVIVLEESKTVGCTELVFIAGCREESNSDCRTELTDKGENITGTVEVESEGSENDRSSRASPKSSEAFICSGVSMIIEDSSLEAAEVEVAVAAAAACAVDISSLIKLTDWGLSEPSAIKGAEYGVCKGNETVKSLLLSDRLDFSIGWVGVWTSSTCPSSSSSEGTSSSPDIPSGIWIKT